MQLVADPHHSPIGPQGLFLPSSATSSPLPEASVIATGPGAPNKDGVIQPMSVKTGDKVLLPSWGGQSIKVGEEVSICGWASGSRQRRRVAQEEGFIG